MLMWAPLPSLAFFLSSFRPGVRSAVRLQAAQAQAQEAQGSLSQALERVQQHAQRETAAQQDLQQLQQLLTQASCRLPLI